MTRHTTTMNIPPARTPAMRAHATDVAFFREHPRALWRVRRKAAGEFADVPRATHVVILTTPTRNRWAAKPLTLPADASDAEVEAAGLAAILALLEASA